MTQDNLWQLQPYTLTELEMYNWGGFGGHHRAQIDVSGTAVIGPTGSGKTTLVDALMTLLTANPKYNLASTGGHESDRDLVSYVRGVSGPGDGGADQSHIARPGKTVTGIAATLDNGEDIVRLGAVLWLDDSSSSPSDMKKLWLFTTSAEQSLQHWLRLRHEGGMRALKQLDQNETGIWIYTSKKLFLARVRGFFEVRENAFNLLNRAAGLKQLNSIDEIFRDLVLDDTSQFERAKEVADSFDDLTDIHEELEIARRQQRSLIPVKKTWEKYQKNNLALSERHSLRELLPRWFGEQAHQLWAAECECLLAAYQQAQQHQANTEADFNSQEKTRDNLKEVFLKLGGSDIQMLAELIQEKQNNLAACETHAHQYQQFMQTLELPDALDKSVFDANKIMIEQLAEKTTKQLQAAEKQAFEYGYKENSSREQLETIKQEIADIRERPGSNIPAKFQHFRAALAAELNLDEDDLPFVAELVQIKEEEQAWRGAIERAIGSHRLRILVSPLSAKKALHWINQRHNQLHVRILEVPETKEQLHFWDDGFTRKLQYKKHVYRQAVKVFLAGIDRHCVASTEQLQHSEHAMTQQGLMSGKTGFFDKQDQKRLDEDWLTGFNNLDRLTLLEKNMAAETAQQQALKTQLQQANSGVAELKQEQDLLAYLKTLEFKQINTEPAARELQQQQEKLQRLTSADSDVTAAKNEFEAADQQLKILDQKRLKCVQKCSQIQQRQEQAERQKDKAFKKTGSGLKEEQRQQARGYFPSITPEQLADIAEIERQAQDQLQSQLDALNNKQIDLVKDLTKCMSDAQREDRGDLSEVGRELEDVPRYLERLQTLTEEALPKKRRRFKEYLNRSSDEGVTQLLMTLDNEVERIEDKLDEVNSTLRKVDFKSGCYLQLVSSKVIHESLRSFNKAKTNLASARFADDEGESHYKALQHIVALLRDACERHRTQSAKALLDPRFRLEFKVSVIDREQGHIIEKRSGSQGSSGGEKEIIASYVLTASLSYALCPDGSSRSLFSTIVLDEAFSRSSHAVAGRIIAALKEFGLHALFITPNKEMRLLRRHTRSAIFVHRQGTASTLATLSWQELEAFHQQRTEGK